LQLSRGPPSCSPPMPSARVHRRAALLLAADVEPHTHADGWPRRLAAGCLDRSTLARHELASATPFAADLGVHPPCSVAPCRARCCFLGERSMVRLPHAPSQVDAAGSPHDCTSSYPPMLRSDGRWLKMKLPYGAHTPESRGREVAWVNRSFPVPSESS
jgi:hypothetical protein